MAALTIQTVATAGVVPTYTAAAGGGDTFAPTSPEKHMLHVKNGGGSINVVIDDPTSTDPGSATAFNPDTTIAVANGSEKMILVDPARFKNTSTGNVAITYSGVTSVTVGVFLVP
jgi:hypothetical protein